MRSLRRAVVVDRAPMIPMSIGNGSCALWLRADSIGLADGAAVDRWRDSSGNGNDATQGTGSLQPLLKKRIANGRDAVRFDGTDDRMVTGVSISSGPFTITAVYAKVGTVIQTRVINGAGANWLLAAHDKLDGLTHKAYNGAFINGATYTAGVFDVVTVTQDSAKAAIYTNGVLGGTNVPANWPGVIGLAQGLFTQICDSDIAEVIIWKGTVLTPRDLSFVHKSLGQKYSRAVA